MAVLSNARVGGKRGLSLFVAVVAHQGARTTRARTRRAQVPLRRENAHPGS